MIPITAPFIYQGTLAQGARASLVYCSEVIPGITPTTPAMKILRATTRGLEAAKNILKSNEVRPDRQVAVVRHGLQKVEGSFGAELGVLSYDDWILAAMGSKKWKQYGGVTANYSTTATTFVRDTGSFITDGFRAGDVITVTGYTNAANNGLWRVTSVAALVLTVDVTYGSPVVEGAVAGKNIFVTGQRVDIGTTLSTFTVEKQFLDAGLYQIFRGVASNGFTLKVSADAIPTLDFPMVGLIPGAMTTSTVASTYVAAATNEPMVAFNGNLYEGGVNIAIVTEIDLLVVNGRSVSGVIGSVYSPVVFEGQSTVTGTLSVFILNPTLFNKFLTEATSSLWLQLFDPNGTDFHNIVANQIKYTGDVIDLPAQGGVVQQLPFQAIVDPVTGTQLSYQRSTFVNVPIVQPTFSYHSGRDASTQDGGTQDVYPSTTLSIDTSGATYIQFNSINLDDLAFMIGVGETVTVARDTNGYGTTTIPSDAIVFTSNDGSMDPEDRQTLTNGTKTAKLGNANTDGFIGQDPTSYMAVIVSKGFTVIAANTPIPLTTFSQFIDGNSIMNFKLVLVPIGIGNLDITSVTLS